MNRVATLAAFILWQAVATAGAVRADLPARVVSMNLCTDQLAMLLAAPGQLISVSHLAADPRSSAMAEQARAYPANRGQAEQIFLMQPDLVLAGSYTSLPAVQLLRDLGVPVVQLQPADALEQIPDQIMRVADAMGRQAAGQALVAEYRAGLAALASDLPPRRAALYYPNGYTTGAGTLANDLLTRAGFHNIAGDTGLSGGGILPLERLVMAAPDLVVTSTPYPGASRSEAVLAHPALALLRGGTAVLPAADADWICGTPAVLRALAQMKTAREAIE